jgi:TetR/AcrR family transcriptional repressor of nem operon
MSDAPAKRRGRPKSKPEDAGARQALIRAGLEHLTEKGYSAVGVDEILRSAEVPKGSFYHYFKSKADFGAQLVEAYHTFFVGMLERSLSNADLPRSNGFALSRSRQKRAWRVTVFAKAALSATLARKWGPCPSRSATSSWPS